MQVVVHLSFSKDQLEPNLFQNARSVMATMQLRTVSTLRKIHLQNGMVNQRSGEGLLKPIQNRIDYMV